MPDANLDPDCRCSTIPPGKVDLGPPDVLYIEGKRTAPHEPSHPTEASGDPRAATRSQAPAPGWPAPTLRQAARDRTTADRHPPARGPTLERALSGRAG